MTLNSASIFDLEQVRSICGAKWLQRPEPSTRPPHITGVGIDSRDDLRQKVFFAIRGATHDGHRFLEQAAQNGAKLLVIETAAAQDIPLPRSVPVMHVERTRRALGRLAQAYRRTLRGTRVIAVTGSSGKTTTKRLIHGALSAAMTGTASPKSFNNDIGVPMTLLAARSSDHYLVVEVGTNAPGEIADLASIVQPDLAVITMIGRSHLERLGTLEGVAKEKAALLGALPRDAGVAVVNADEPLLRPHLKPVKTRILFGERADDADLRLTARGASDQAGRWWFEINGRTRFALAMPGRHNAVNALAAVAVARRLGLDDEAIGAGLLSVTPEAMRMTPQVVGRGASAVTIYNDAYNANPDSMIVALDTFSELASAAPRRVVILGDMLELGVESEALHREIARHLLRVDERARIDRVMLIGERMSALADALAERWRGRRLLVAPTLDQRAIEAALAMIRRKDAVLVKASRGIGLERVIWAFEQRAAAAPPSRRAVKTPA